MDQSEIEKTYNKIAEKLFKIDYENNEFNFIMLSSLLSLLIQKGVITEEEFAKATKETGEAFKLMKFRNNIHNTDTDKV